MIRVTVWNEFLHEKTDEKVKSIYPEGIHKAIAEFLGKNEDMEVKTITLDDENCGITDELLENTDVMIWWGHMRHWEVPDEIAIKVKEAVLRGMGMVFLHSAHFSKPFQSLMGTTCSLKWREAGERERLWNIEPGHPITEGIGEYFELPHVEMYGERFDIPDPDKVIFISWYQGGEVFRSGVTFERGYGRIFYFSPGHETFPIFYDENIRKVLANAARWAAPRIIKEHVCPFVEPLENIKKS